MPSLSLWRLQDIGFHRKVLERLKAELSNAEAHTFDDICLFVAEEALKRIVPLIRAFIWAEHSKSDPRPSCVRTCCSSGL